MMMMMMMMMMRAYKLGRWFWVVGMHIMIIIIMLNGGLVVVVNCDAQTRLLNKGCSQFSVTDPSSFNSNLNLSFSDLQAQLRSNRRFATTIRIPVYAMVQCRNYMSTNDCLACYRVAQAQIRNCSAPTGPANGARVIYEGCFLRYESNPFFDETTRPGNTGICKNQTVSKAGAFNTSVGGMLLDLQIATPKIKGFFAATQKQVIGELNTTVHGVAQCAETITKTGCEECLKVAFQNLQGCVPDSGGSAVDAGCFLRYSDTAFFAANQTTILTPFLKNGGSSKNAAIIGGVAGGTGLFLLLLGFFFWFRRSRKSKAVTRGNILDATELQGPLNYHYKDLKSATKNFSEENKLGEGGFGDVYKGTLRNGKIVAVKKLAIAQSRRAKEEFESEVKLISNVHHRNLVRLLGCCSKGPELLLVYEFMPNSSLDKFLFGEKRGTLNWKQRYDIIMGTARGLAYLHEEFHVCIIHRDIKTSNILLDGDFYPRIADFGLARLLPEDRSHLSTRFAGTLGYTAPEYAIHGQLSEKADTYSYGVVVLEIISGQKSNEIKPDSAGEYLLERAWKLYENEKHLDLVDETLDRKDPHYEEENVKKVIEIALMCTQSSPIQRPTMSEVVALLKSKGSFEQRTLSRPVFIDVNQRTRAGSGADTSTSTASSNSNATVSISHYSGR
ncbi:cold-responsive protein kinase 1-like [Ziziphus jujuba]|uniref:Cold-responsive protein kinase 1-like n=1 Tax=Ziziphus jujuba TaxID=326968 RepID=A0A6P3ZK79_ZIZJJ|nr:cold-responsive protein kinase 1-like [Ziziphus jujuba]